MSRNGHQMVRYADDMVILCPSAEAAEHVLQTLREWSSQAQLELHPEKTKIDSAALRPCGAARSSLSVSLRSAVDMGQPGANFDFLGYKFWRSKTNGSILRLIRTKSEKKFKASIKPMTRRTSGQSLEAIIRCLRPKLRGFYGYFKHASERSLGVMDGWIRGRLRSILRKRAGLPGRGRGRDHQRWNNRYFTDLGFFSLETARKLESINLRRAVHC